MIWPSLVIAIILIIVVIVIIIGYNEQQNALFYPSQIEYWDPLKSDDSKDLKTRGSEAKDSETKDQEIPPFIFEDKWIGPNHSWLFTNLKKDSIDSIDVNTGDRT